MTVEIPRELQEFVEHLISSGRYPSASEVVAAALDALDEKHAAAELPPGELEPNYPGLRRAVAEGLADLDAGRESDGEEFFDELDRELSGKLPQDRKTA